MIKTQCLKYEEIRDVGSLGINEERLLEAIDSKNQGVMKSQNTT